MTVPMPVKRGGWTRAGAHASSPSMVTKKSRSSKCMCVPKTQLTPWLAIRGLMRMSKHVKGPYLGR
jgi:hypothetical protein